MIGNDIVDLNASLIHSRWKEQRFLDKLFNTHEQEFILKDEFRFQNSWYLWSMKESVYKIVAREKKFKKFNPKAFHCEIVSSRDNSVRFEDQHFKTHTIIQNDFIYSTAVSKPIEFSSKWIPLHSTNPKEQQVKLHEACIGEFAHLKAIPQESISIQNCKMGIPQLYIEGTLQKNCLSFSHHGFYGAFAIAM